MLISGFTFARNTEKLGYPTVESIRSILPICDEFIIAVGKGDDDDCTREKIAAIGDPRITIIDTDWSDLDKLKSRIYSQQTNLALSRCRGTWCLYLQCDEVIHEQYLRGIQHACTHFAQTPSIDGFVFKYKHFWGDYDHYIIDHKWYPREIRIIRNHKEITSVGDAQSFRYRNNKKIPVVELDAEVFHYGHVRDPRLIHIRKQSVNRIYHGIDPATSAPQEQLFNYGSLEHLPKYSGTYPDTMKQRIAALSWRHLITYQGQAPVVHGFDHFKHRFITFLEQKIFRGSGREFWGYKPYKIRRAISARYRREAQKAPDNGPAASLVIAVYNRPDFLEKVFCSVKRQSFTNIEIIIADDGSGPDIATLIMQYSDSFAHPIKHIRHDDDGFRKTIIVNRAVLAATSPYCIFIDGDSILHHRFIEFHLKRKSRGTVLSGRRVMMNEALSNRVTLEDIATGDIEKLSYWRGKCRRWSTKHGIFIPGIFPIKNLRQRKVHDILGANFSVYRDDFLSINGYDENIIGRGLEDDNLSMRFSMAGISVKSIAHEALQYHLDHPSDPIPHSKEFIREFRDNPKSARTPFGVFKESTHE